MPNDTRDRVFAILRADPRLSAADVAKALQVSRQRVHCILRDAGWKQEWREPPTPVSNPAIYGLADPREPDRIRYVGRSIHPEKRYASHCDVGDVDCPDVLRGTWVGSLKRVGLRPLLVILEHAPANDLPALEGIWVRRLKREGQADLNRDSAVMTDAAVRAYLKSRKEPGRPPKTVR